MAKKIIKKAAAKATTTTTKKATTAKKTVSVKDIANITNCDDFYCLIRDTYNAENDNNITKDEVSKVWKAVQTALTEFCTKSDADEATCILPEIGVLTAFIKAEHDSINPRTKEKVRVPQKKRVRFRAYPRFTNAINK